MFQHILVPLDGSRRAESAIPVAATIARATGGSLLLLRVATLSTDTVLYVQEPLLFPDAPVVDEFQVATAYLKQQAQKLRDLSVQTLVISGSAAQKILLCIEEKQIDLVVLCSRGETGLNQWLLGSVAHKVVRQSPVPALVLHESAGPLSNNHPMGFRPVRILVALDGSKLAEAALKPAAVLTTALSAPEKGALHLVRILPESTMTQMAVDNGQLPAIREAQAYLQTMEQALYAAMRGKGEPSLTSSVVVRNHVAQALIGVAEDGLPASNAADARLACDVLALTTHGRTGLMRWITGSIAEQLLDNSRLPLLVVHPALQNRTRQPETLTVCSSSREEDRHRADFIRESVPKS